MKLEGTYTFDAPLPLVWRALFDADVLAKTLPGCDKLERDGNQFKGDINVKMGPVQGKFQGKVDIVDVIEPSSYTMAIDGRGPAGFVKATAQIGLSAEANLTRLAYDSDVQVGGRVASVGQRLLEASARAILKQSLEGLHEQIKALSAREPAELEGAAEPAAAGPEAAAPPAAGIAVAAAPEVPAASLGSLGAPSASAAGEPAGQGARAPALEPQAFVAPPALADAAPAPLAAGMPPGGQGPSPAAAEANASRPTLPPKLPRSAPVMPAPRAPSQAAFAFGVAKEVTKELLPVRTLLVIAGVLLLAWAIYSRVKAS